MENHSGLKKLLRIPCAYYLLMDIFGAKKAALWLSKNFYKVQFGAKITDIGCGPGSLLKNYNNIFPNNIDYHGIDPDKEYILSAKREFGHSANFYHGTTENFINAPEFRESDLIFCCGVLHHLEDDQVLSLFNFVNSNLKTSGGRFLAIEPVHLLKQTFISKLVMNLDRGLYIRKEQEWKNLLNNSNLYYTTNIITGLIKIPYNYILIEGKI